MIYTSLQDSHDPEGPRSRRRKNQVKSALYSNFWRFHYPCCLQLLSRQREREKSTTMAAEDDQSRKISLKRGLGPAPENPVCDSGIFCYGKPIFSFLGNLQIKLVKRGQKYQKWDICLTSNSEGGSKVSVPNRYIIYVMHKT